MKIRKGIFYTGKDRLISFTDGVLAILMTILVLGLKQPAAADLNSFLELKESYFAYTLSFFWLGILWLIFNNVFAIAEKVDNYVGALNLILLFACSLIPYLTELASSYFYSRLVQLIFGIWTIIINLTVIVLFRLLIRCNPDIPVLAEYAGLQIRMMTVSLLILIAGLLLAWFWYPPLMMAAIVLSTLCSALLRLFYDRRAQKKADRLADLKQEKEESA